MALRSIGSVALPPHRRAGGFDHASVYRGTDRLHVAHTANESVEVIDLGRRTPEATLEGFPGVAGAAVHEGRALLVATCRGEGTVGLAALSNPGAITRLSVGARPNGLALAAGTDLALAACIGDPTPPSYVVIDLGRSEVLAWVSLPGRPRWVVHDEEARCFYVNVAAPPQIAVVLQSVDTTAACVVETITTERGPTPSDSTRSASMSTCSYPERMRPPCSRRHERSMELT